MKKLTVEQMKEQIKKKNYYITYYKEYDEYELSHYSDKKGYNGGVQITKERAEEWIAAGASLEVM